MYGYTIPLFSKCYMRHGKHLTGMGNPIYHITTSNYTQDMLSSYADFWNKEIEPCTSSVVYLSNGEYSCMYMLSHYFVSVV